MEYDKTSDRTAEVQTRVLAAIAAAILHDLNNSLNALTLGLARMMANPELEKFSADLQKLTGFVNAGAASVRGLQPLLKPVRPEALENVSLAREAAAAAAIARRECEHRAASTGFEVELAQLPDVVAVPRRVRNLFATLFLDAIETMNAATVRVTGLAFADAVEVKLQALAAGGSPARQPALESTGGEEGAAACGALVRALFERCGGSVITAHAASGGAAITLRFPLRAQGTGGSPAARRCRLLLIDSNPDSLQALQLLLRTQGHEVDTCTRSDAAIGQVRAARYDAVICDPGVREINGWQLISAIGEAAPQTPVLLLTACDEGGNEARRRLIGELLRKSAGAVAPPALFG
jgi:CheY-like chemotaxis protein